MYHYVYLIHNIKEHKAYFGVRSSRCKPEDDIKYMSSSKVVKELYKTNKEDFIKRILKVFSTRKEALEWEIYLHSTYNVGVNPSFYNKSKQTSVGFSTSGTTVPSRRIKYNYGEMLGNHSLSFVKEIKTSSEQRRAIFKCICGKEFEANISKIKCGHTKSCGCLRNIQWEANKIEYSIGEIIGNYNIAYIKDVGSSATRRKALFKCHCGKEFISSIADVKISKIKSCGCSRNKKSHRYIDYSKGTVLGNYGITYLYELPPTGRNRHAMFRCTCGTQFIGLVHNVIRGTKKSCGCLKKLGRKNFG